MKFCIILNGDIDEVIGLHYLVKNFSIDLIIHEEKYVDHDIGIKNIYDVLQELNKNVKVCTSNKGKCKYINNFNVNDFVNIVDSFYITNINKYNFVALGVFKTLRYIINNYDINYFHCFIGKTIFKDDIEDWDYINRIKYGKCYSLYEIKTTNHYNYIIENNYIFKIKQNDQKYYCLNFVIQVFRN
jgi:hypothetical protein